MSCVRSWEELCEVSGEELCEESGEELCEESGEELCEESGEELCEESGEELCERLNVYEELGVGIHTYIPSMKSSTSHCLSHVIFTA